MSLMLGTVAVTAFLATTDGSRAKKFYRDVLGLSLVSEDRFALVFDLNGTELRVQKVQELVAQSFTVLGWQVPDIREAVAELSRRGVAFERYPSLEQDDHCIWQAPSGASVAWFEDPDGNVLSVTQRSLRT